MGDGALATDGWLRPTRLPAYLALLRPPHWLKNGLLFVPLLLAHDLTAAAVLLATCAAFVCMCLAPLLLVAALLLAAVALPPSFVGVDVRMTCVPVRPPG